MNYIYSIKNCDICQSDIDLEKEFSSKWVPKKTDALIIADSYKRLKKYNKCRAVTGCGSFLEFYKPHFRLPMSELCSDTATESGWKLKEAFFCRDTLCPLCQWRKSLKMYSQISSVMDRLDGKYSFVFLTLTCRNCSGRELSNTIDSLLDGWRRMKQYKRFVRAVRGFIRVLEIEYHQEYSEDKQYHPHLHVILAVDFDYFVSDKYINQQEHEWSMMWKKALRADYEPFVYVQKTYNRQSGESGSSSDKSIKSSVRELGKYVTKSKDYTNISDDKSRDRVIDCLSSALYKRRLCAFGGVFEDVRKMLHLDDIEDGDLIHINNDIRPDLCYIIRRYQWGAGAYNLIEEYEDIYIDIEVV